MSKKNYSRIEQDKSISQCGKPTTEVLLSQILEILQSMHHDGLKFQDTQVSYPQSNQFDTLKNGLLDEICKKLGVAKHEEISVCIEELQTDRGHKAELENMLKSTLKINEVEPDEVRRRLDNIFEEKSNLDSEIEKIKTELDKVKEEKEMFKKILEVLKKLFGFEEQVSTDTIEKLEKHLKQKVEELQCITRTIKESLGIKQVDSESIRGEIQKIKGELEKQIQALEKIKKALSLSQEASENDIEKLILGLTQDKDELEHELEQLKKSFYFDLYEKYKTLPEEFRANFKTRINGENHITFIQGITEDTLNNLYENIKKQITNKKGIINEDIEKEIAFFDEMFECIRQEGWTRFEPQIGDSFNPQNEEGVGAAKGKINKILLKGYQAGKKAKSLVEVSE